MGNFPAATCEAVERTYTNAGEWIHNLESCNERRASSIRDDYIDHLSGLMKQIEASQFLDRDDFTDAEQSAIVETANEIASVIAHIRSQNYLTLCDLQLDLGDLIQHIALDKMFGLLRGRWLSTRGTHSKRPKDVPAEVRDDYNMGILIRCEVTLNQRATALKPIADLQCLNPDDYNGKWFASAQINAVNLSSRAAIDKYLQAELEKRLTEIEAKEQEGPGIGGIIWGIVGWDDPWDFAKDMALFVATGGASKVLRWADKLNDARKGIKKARRGLRALETTEVKFTSRLDRLASTSRAARSVGKIQKFPEKIIKLIEAADYAEKKYAYIAKAGSVVSGNFIRGVLTSVAANLAVNQSSKSLDVQASYELARTAAMQYLDKFHPFSEIKSLRPSIGFEALLKSDKTEDDVRIGRYIAYVWLQEFIIRIVIAVLHQSNLVHTTVNRIAGDRTKPIVTAQMARDEAIAALGAAAQRIVYDVTNQKTLAEKAALLAATFARKTLVEMVQMLVNMACKD